MPNDTKVRVTSLPSPYDEDAGSYFAKATWTMEDKRREQEQRILATLAKVHIKEHANPEENRHQGPGEGYENTAKAHPMVGDSPRYDGAPDTDTQIPSQSMDPETKRELENQTRDKELRKELKKELQLGHQPQQAARFHPTPR